jgi:type 1 glutamine amidotransferase
MKYRLFFIIVLAVFTFLPGKSGASEKNIRLLVVTGGHDYNKEQFNNMFAGLGNNFSFTVAELPAAFDMFRPENRNKYDVLVFYHMWQKITPEQEKVFSECISQGKPLVVLHHSICAFDDWPEYFNIVGGKYFHKPTVVNGKEYAPCTYQHDLHFNVKIADKKHPVTKGLKDFEVFDEAYKGYYIEPGVKVLLTTDEALSNNVIGWTKVYGKARVVTIQSGHDVPTFQNENFRQLLRQAIEWVNKGVK